MIGGESWPLLARTRCAGRAATPTAPSMPSPPAAAPRACPTS